MHLENDTDWIFIISTFTFDTEEYLISKKKCLVIERNVITRPKNQVLSWLCLEFNLFPYI